MVEVQIHHALDTRLDLLGTAAHANRFGELRISYILFHCLASHPFCTRLLERIFRTVAPFQSSCIIVLVEAEKIGWSVQVAILLMTVCLLRAGIERIALLQKLREMKLLVRREVLHEHAVRAVARTTELPKVSHVSSERGRSLAV